MDKKTKSTKKIPVVIRSGFFSETQRHVYIQNPPQVESRLMPEKMHNPIPINQKINPTQISHRGAGFIFKVLPNNKRKIAIKGIPMVKSKPSVIHVAEDGFISACCNGRKSFGQGVAKWTLPVQMIIKTMTNEIRTTKPARPIVPAMKAKKTFKHTRTKSIKPLPAVRTFC